MKTSSLRSRKPSDLTSLLSKCYKVVYESAGILYTVSTMEPDYKKSEEKALELLRRYEIEEPFVDVFSIAQGEGLSVKFIEFPKKFDNVAGYLDPEEKSIVVNKSQQPNRQTFTVAHELGHYILEHKPSDYSVLLRMPVAKDKKTPQEKEADVFAANLLVPREMLLVTMQRYSLNKGNVDLLARIFGVSTETMSHRLNRCVPQ